MRLTLVRHGQSPSNLETKLDSAAPGPSLTELEVAQAAALPQRVARNVDVLYTSHLTRAQETAAPLAAAHGITPLVREGLREVIAGDLEMRNDPEALVVYRSAFLAWSRGELDLRMPGGEDGHETLARYDAVVQEALDAGVEHAVLVTHGAVVRTWVGARAVNVDGFHGDPRLANTGVVELHRTADGTWVLDNWDGLTAEELAPFSVPIDADDLYDRLSFVDQKHA
jgi:broad specificity phosphatase PhoE